MILNNRVHSTMAGFEDIFHVKHSSRQKRVPFLARVIELEAAY